jgi:hypothetical protein
VEVRTPLLNLLIVLVVVLRARFLHHQQTEDDDEHEHDQEVPRLNRTDRVRIEMRIRSRFKVVVWPLR